jgi:hypothetical protein
MLRIGTVQQILNDFEKDDNVDDEYRRVPKTL